MDEENLYDLKKRVSLEVLKKAEKWAREQVDGWSHGTYYPDYFIPFFEKSYMRGYIDGQRESDDAERL